MKQEPNLILPPGARSPSNPRFSHARSPTQVQSKSIDIPKEFKKGIRILTTLGVSQELIRSGPQGAGSSSSFCLLHARNAQRVQSKSIYISYEFKEKFPISETLGVSQKPIRSTPQGAGSPSSFCLSPARNAQQVQSKSIDIQYEFKAKH